jgi:hypothetical protein
MMSLGVTVEIIFPEYRQFHCHLLCCVVYMYAKKKLIIIILLKKSHQTLRHFMDSRMEVLRTTTYLSGEYL